MRAGLSTKNWVPTATGGVKPMMNKLYDYTISWLLFFLTTLAASRFRALGARG